MGLANQLYTLVTFVSACLLVPGTVVLYIAVNTTRAWWIGLLSQWYPDLQFVRNITVRTATETKRNQGIITLLLTVKGRYDVELIRERLKEHILNRKKKNGDLMFPHLQTALTTKYGRYAWSRETSSFNIENHVLEGSCLYRGKIVNDLNIQEYVSEIVAKYLPQDMPPWQITIIPCFPADRFFLLIRIHHLLLSEEGLSLGDLLLLGPEKSEIFNRLLDEDDENPKDVPAASSPLTELFQTPVAIPKLYSRLCDSIKHCWENLVSRYDPVENPQVAKAEANIPMCSAIVLITSIAVVREVLIVMKKSNVPLLKRLGNINSIVHHEVEKRQCTPWFVANGIINSCKPERIVLSSFKWFMYAGYFCSVTVPTVIAYEMRAIAMQDRSKGYSTQVTDVTFSYTALIVKALKEILYICSVVYTAPRLMLEELIISHRDPQHELQRVSLCGRKVVSWSDPVPLDRIRRIGSTIGASPSEILISATSGALREYFRNAGYSAPDSVLTTARFFPLESLTNIAKGGPPSGRGLLCLALPTSQLHEDPRDLVQEMQKILAEARDRQTAIYEASLWQLDGGYITKILPSLTVKLVLNYLSRRYSVALTEVAPEVPDQSKKQLIWGQEVESIMYWRPPQSNICLSLTLMNYGGSVRLGVMADSMIAPGHATVTTAFLQHISMLAAMAGVPRDRSHHYQPNIPPEAPGMSTSESSASEELRRLTQSSPELNASFSPGTTRSCSPDTRSSNEENIFPFTD